MESYLQPPDSPDEGNCRRCKRCITRDELLEDGCTECDDLLISDMERLWQGRPKCKPFGDWYQFNRQNCQGVDTRNTRYVPTNWTGLLTPPYFGNGWKP